MYDKYSSTTNFNSFDYWKIYPYLTCWYCDKGTTAPKPDNAHTKGAGITLGTLADSNRILFGDQSRGIYYYYEHSQIFSTNKEGTPIPDEYPYVQRVLSMASGAFTGTLGKTKNVDDIIIGWDKSFITQEQSPVYLFKTQLDSSKNFSGFGNAKEIFRTSSRNAKIGLIGADFLGEGVDLESPVHLKIEGERTYAAILQTTPYHVDNIPLPWADNTTPQVTNFTYSTGLKTMYSHESKSETSQDIKFDMKRSVETIEALGMGITETTVFKNVASYALSKGAGVQNGAQILDGLVDKVELTKTEADKSLLRKTLTDKVETSTSDRLLYYSTNVHVWRYPIKEPAPSWLLSNLIEGTAASANSDKFLTFTIADSPVLHTTSGLEDENYQPLHEEGNLFSYPTSLAQIEGYTNKLLDLTDQSSITYSPGSHIQTISINQSATKVSTEARKVKHGTISSTVGCVKVMAGKATENSTRGERGNTSTFTKRHSTTDTLTVAFPNPEGDYADVTFTTDVQAYSDEAGILTLGFAVNNFGSTARLWQKSIYNEKPDPALYLPYKYHFDKNKVIARDEETIATKMRGLRFVIPATNAYTGSTLDAGQKYRIDVPIYNASFKAVDGEVEVRLSYREKGSTTSTPIDTKSVKIGGWEAGKDTNKAMLSFEWTLPITMSPGKKELVVEIDPNNTIDEIHEGWDAKLPGGNNFGYFPFSVVSATGVNAGDGDLDAGNFSITIDGKSMEDFISYAASQSQPFDAECVLTNNNKSNYLVVSFELNIITSDDEEIESFTRNIGFTSQGQKENFNFLANPDDWKKCKRLEAVIYTDNEVVSMSASPNSHYNYDGNEDNETNEGSEINPSSGGCNSVISWLGLGIILGAFALNRKAH